MNEQISKDKKNNTGDSITNVVLSSLPRWAFAFAALIIALSIGYGMFVADCTTNLFGLSFGKNRPCDRADFEIVARVKKLEEENQALKDTFDILGTRDRGYVELNITNHGRGDNKGCPSGSFVSGITAPGGVGGKYATDGINKISFKCSPLKLNKSNK